jgi:hypothetical protein
VTFSTSSAGSVAVRPCLGAAKDAAVRQPAETRPDP